MRFDDSLETARRRKRLARALGDLGRIAPLIAAGYVFFVLRRRVQDPAFSAWIWLIWPVAAAAVVLLIAFFLRAVRRIDVAVALDRELGFKEALSTAVTTADRSASVAGPEWSAAVAAAAESRASVMTPEHVRAVFRLPKPYRLGAAAAVCIAAHLMPLGFLPVERSNDQAAAEAQKKKDAAGARTAREAARRLEARAQDLARLAEAKKLEAAKRAAEKAAAAARKLAEEADTKKDALSGLSQMSKDIEKAKADAIGADQKSDAFKNPLDDDPLADMAKKLDQLDSDSLGTDLDQFAKDLKAEGKDAKAGNRTPRVDRRRLEDLMKRLQMAKETLRRLQEAAKENPELQGELSRLSEEQRKLLERIYQKLEKLESQCSGSGGGEELTEEELREVAEFLESLKKEDLEKLMRMMREGAAMEDLEELVDGARKEANGEGQQMSGARMAELLERLARVRGATPEGGKSEKRGEGEGEGQNGSKEGGEGHAETDGLGGHPGDPDAARREHVQGKVDPKGNQGAKVPFKGIPKPKEAAAAFDETVRRAAADAEEGLAKDRVPPALRPYVKRYFDAIRKKDGEKK